jgi:hypothetical protein
VSVGSTEWLPPVITWLAYLYVYTYIHIYMHACIHIYMHTCIHAYTYRHIHTYMLLSGECLGPVNKVLVCGAFR